MAPARRRKRREDISVSIGPFRHFADYAACVEIQREVWRFDDIDIVPAPLLIAMEHAGGANLGAFSALGEMIGFVCSMPGYAGGELHQHSHMLAVRTAYRNFEVGFKLKLAQRKEALRRKIGLITWTFDPMQPLNAYFNLGKLGAWTRVYEEDFYGETTSTLHHGVPTDRFLVRWELSGRRVAERLAQGQPRHDLRKELKKFPVITKLEILSPGIAGCSAARLGLSEPQLLCEIPYNLPEIKKRNVGVALEWQGKLRQVFRSYFKKGYVATDFWVAEDEGHLRSFYFLEKNPR